MAALALCQGECQRGPLVESSFQLELNG